MMKEVKMPKQTAVEWLIKELNQEIDYIPMNKWDIIADKIQQALELEKEQIMEGYIMALLDGDAKIRRDAEDYYNDTYGGQDE
jgi:hypothetical protein